MKPTSNEPEEPQELTDHALAHAAEHETAQKPHSVMSYLAILFAAAFLLMLLSFLMQQRANNRTIEGLKQSVSAMESLTVLQEEKTAMETQRNALEKQAAELAGQIESLEAENQQLSDDLASGTRSAQAMDWFWRIQREVSRGRYSSARKLVDGLKTAGLEDALPADHPADPEGPSPAEQYQEILQLLY